MRITEMPTKIIWLGAPGSELHFYVCAAAWRDGKLTREHAQWLWRNVYIYSTFSKDNGCVKYIDDIVNNGRVP